MRRLGRPTASVTVSAATRSRLIHRLTISGSRFTRIHLPTGPTKRSNYEERRAHNVLRDGDDFGYAIPRCSLPGKVQVKLVLQYPLGEVPHTEQRILHGFAEKTPAQEVVVERDAHVVDEVRALSTMEEIQVIPPAGEEKLPLQLGQLKKLCAFTLLQPPVLQRHE
jgi:hypothetical protein